MKNRLKRFFVAKSKRLDNDNAQRSNLTKIVAALNFVAESKRLVNDNAERSDLAKIVAALNQTLSPHVNAKMVGDEAVFRCENKTVWINTHCLVTGESSISS
jgi:hypothetical protein